MSELPWAPAEIFPGEQLGRGAPGVELGGEWRRVFPSPSDRALEERRELPSGWVLGRSKWPWSLCCRSVESSTYICVCSIKHDRLTIFAFSRRQVPPPSLVSPCGCPCELLGIVGTRFLTPFQTKCSFRCPTNKKCCRVNILEALEAEKVIRKSNYICE